MANVALTRSQKRRIRRRVSRRASELEDRLQSIPEGVKIPNKDNQRLNEPKKFELAMVFLDIDGFSDYVFENSDVSVLFMLGIVMPEFMKLVTEYGGYFEKNTGDGLLAYFGFGKSREEAVTELLSYLSTVRWALEHEINPLLEDEGLDRISTSAGATYGEVYLTRIGERDRGQELNRLTGVSSAANIASKIEEMATDGRFLTGPNVWLYADNDAFGDLFTFHDMIPDIAWNNPSSGNQEPYQIFEYNGAWESPQDDGGSRD